MAGMFAKVLIVLIAALALVAGASAASPDIAAMNLQAVDVPGAKIVNEHTVKEPGYVAAYFRSFVFTAPGSTRLFGIDSETALAADVSQVTADVKDAETPFRTKAGRKAIVNALAKTAKVKAKAIALGQPRTVNGYDQGFQIAASVGVKGGRVYENIVIVRLDRVLVEIVMSALRPISAGTTQKYTTAIAGHIGTELVPVAVSPPTVTGNAQQGQTLTATPGTWTASDATFGYQWQRCDAAGANCVDVPGATTSTYAVTAADVGTTLRVVVTATNRFGSAPGTSAQTAVVT
jgi:hypothetical protein